MNSSPKTFQEALKIATIEKDLKSLLNPKIFEKLNIPKSSIPLIEQKLPRVEGNSFYLKKGYHDLDLLQTKSLRKAICSLYPRHVEESPKTITLFTYVMEGLGDLAIQQRLFKLIKKQFPTLSINIITMINEKHKNYVSPFSKTHHFVFYQGLKPPKPQTFSKKVLSLLHHSELVCMIPTYYPYVEDLLQNYVKYSGAVEGIGEYGFYHSRDFHPESPYHSLGLHFLEIGLLFPSQSTQDYKNLLSYQNKSTLKYLLNSEVLDEKALSRYFQTNSMHFAYLQTQKSHDLFLNVLLKLNQKADKTIDLVTTNIAGFYKALENLMNSKELKSVPLQSFEIFFDNKRCFQKCSESGMKLRIIHLGKLTEDEFSTFLNLSAEPCGVRGNISITDAIFFDKTFIYDCPEHCINFLYSLIDLLETKFKNYPFLKELFEAYLPKANLKVAIDKICYAMNHPEFTVAISKLRNLLLESFDGRHNIKNIITRSLFHIDHPKIKITEQSYLDKYLKKEISLENFFMSIKNCISEMDPST